jgi:hypothetical protein
MITDILKWYPFRDPNTTVISYTLEDEVARVYATVAKGGKKGWLVTVAPSVPFSRGSLITAKRDAEWILNNRK